MTHTFKKAVAFVAALLVGSVATFAQAPEATAKWSVSSKHVKDNVFELTFKANIVDGWHIYTVDHPYNPTVIEFAPNNGYSLDGKLVQVTKPTDLQDEKVFFDSVKLTQLVKLTGSEATVSGEVSWSGCNDKFCAAPEAWEFSVPLVAVAPVKAGVAETARKESSEGTVAVSPDNGSKVADGVTVDSKTGDEASSSIAVVADSNSGTGSDSSAKTNDVAESADGTISADEAKSEGSLWALIIEAILWGFAMLLTPCVFPMVPMTVSFFMKQSTTAAEGRFKAFVYGLFIVLLYTVPISVIIGLTWLIGGNAVTADIFNWLATHWLPNLIFFIVFMVFAASFFGAFEIELPSSLANKSDAKSSGKGLGGIFFMALTLVLVSFSCTGPIVGTVLIKSTQGEFWTPMVTMLAFSVAFALPFTVLAMFPSLLKKMKGKSGSWLNSVKVVLGFIEVALGFKFLSVADQTYHWGLLDREVYLGIWIVTFSMLGFYLLGRLRFKNDDPVEHVSVPRLGLAIAVFTFVAYMIPGMWGAPLKALSGYLPPMETQDFVVWNYADSPSGQAARSGSTATVAAEKTGAVGDAASNAISAYGQKYDLKMPLGLSGYFTLEEGLAAAKAQNKPLFVDITGHGCVNCREMEQRVWSDPRVLNILRNEYVLVALYVDDKTKLDEQDWLTTADGKILKQIGRANSYIARTRFGVNAQPNYALLDPDGNPLSPVRGYDLSVEGFIDFLNSGLRK